jgi:hypothetical protein
MHKEREYSKREDGHAHFAVYMNANIDMYRMKVQKDNTKLDTFYTLG